MAVLYVKSENSKESCDSAASLGWLFAFANPKRGSTPERKLGRPYKALEYQQRDACRCECVAEESCTRRVESQLRSFKNVIFSQ